MCASAIWPTAAAAWLSSSFSAPGGKLEFAPPERDGAGGHEHHLLLARAQAQQVLDQGFEPGPIDLSRGLIDEQRRADLDDDAACTS